MESFEFLGGRYNRPEQIMSGPVQAFKAQNAANGRTVFIHRVSTTEAPDEQSALLKLLTTALVKSSDAKRLVLDFGEDRGHWYVVTESEPQCALLREWLQTEIANALVGSKLVATQPATPSVAKPTVSPLAPAHNPDAGEFTRFLQRPSVSSPPTARIIDQKPVATPPAQASATVGEFSRLFQSPSANPVHAVPISNDEPAAPAQPDPVQPASAPLRPPPGEFTNFFNAADIERKNKAPQTPAVPPFQDPSPQVFPGLSQGSEEKKEPGEFTRFFTPGLPSVPPKQTAPPPPVVNFERTQNNPYVQRPNSPIPPPAPPVPKQTEAGEFTRMFSSRQPASSQPPQQPYQPPAVRSDPMGFNKPLSSQSDDLSDNLFNDKIDVGKPLPSSQPQHSEFTKVFGAVGSEAPAIQPPAVVSAQREKSMLDEAHGTQQLPVMRPQSPGEQQSSGESPSEFTMIMKGGYGKPATDAGGPSAAGPLSSSGGAVPINLQVSSINPMMGAMSQLPSASGSVAGVQGNVSQHGASASSALGSAHMSGPKIPAANLQMPGVPKAAANKKLMLFFVLLGVLTLLLIIVIMILMKSK